MSHTGSIRVLATTLSVAAFTLISGPTPSSAQQTASVTGSVASAASGQALSGAQVTVVGTGLGQITNLEGRFLLLNVPAGSHEVQVTFLGYRTETQQVDVVAGETVEIQFSLAISQIELDEIVVTGTGAPTQRRRLGQTIASIDTEQLEGTGVTNITQALQGRVTGLTGAVGNRATGQADLPVLRGLSSLTQRNEPLIYVDGIRMNNAKFMTAGVTSDQLSNMNAADIERIEVIKGAAAATLFGTEASSGVIQIFTKRGRTGAPSYTFSMDQQVIHMPQSKFLRNYGWDSDAGQLVQDKPAEAWVDLGLMQNYNMSVSGGSQNTQFFISGRYQEENGAIPQNEMTNASLRAAFDFQHTDQLSTSIDVDVRRNWVMAPQPAWSSIVSQWIWANPNRISEARPHGEPFAATKDLLHDTDQSWTNTYVISGKADYQFTEGLSAQIRIGHHFASRNREHMRPEGLVGGRNGLREVWADEIESQTLEATLAWDVDITDGIHSNFVVGGQRFAEGLVRERTSVADFPASALRTLRGGSRVTFVDEFTEDIINAGVFVQEQIGFGTRLFITGGLRMDGNSAFGSDFGLEAYPKAGVSWVVSEHEFFDVPSVDWLRLRGAFGTSGQQPGAFDAQQVWRSISFAPGAALAPLNQGNPELKPERSTEIEFGLETGLFDGRLGLDVVYFDQETKDALLPRSPAPSTGFQSSQLSNLGRINSNGWEVAANLRAIERRGLRWDLNAAFSTIDQVVSEMGGTPDFRLQTRYRWGHIAEGYAPGAVIAPVRDPARPYIVTVPIDELTKLDQIQPNTLKNAAGADSLVWMGNPQPKWTVNFGTRLQLGDRLTLHTLFSGAGGDYIMSNETGVIRTAGTASWTRAYTLSVLNNPSASAAEKTAAADLYGRRHPSIVSNWMQKADYLRWNELGLTYELSNNWASWVGIGAGSTQVSLGLRNLHIWTGYGQCEDSPTRPAPDAGVIRCGQMDPGTASTGWPGQGADGITGLRGGVFGSNIDYGDAPSARRYILSIRTTW